MRIRRIVSIATIVGATSLGLVACNDSGSSGGGSNSGGGSGPPYVWCDWANGGGYWNCGTTDGDTVVVHNSHSHKPPTV
jgi:hypothetical protein